MRGDIIDMRVSKKEAEKIWEVTKKMYFDSTLYDEFVMNFNHRPDKYDFEKFKKQFDLA